MAATTDLVLAYRGRDPGREENLVYFLRHTHRAFPSSFRYVLVEQDTETRVPDSIMNLIDEYILLHNPTEHFCKGWAYNIAAQSLCRGAVAVFCDIDMVLDDSVHRCIERCGCGEVDFASPYNKVYFTGEQEAREIREGRRPLPTAFTGREKTYTIFGGVFVCRLASFLDIGGMEEMGCYAWEDSIMDKIVTSPGCRHTYDLRSHTYIHMHHPPVANRKSCVRQHMEAIKTLFSWRSQHKTPSDAIRGYIQLRKSLPFGCANKYRHRSCTPLQTTLKRLSLYHRELQKTLSATQRVEREVQGHKVLLVAAPLSPRDSSIVESICGVHRVCMVGTATQCKVMYCSGKHPGRDLCVRITDTFSNAEAVAGRWLGLAYSLEPAALTEADCILLHLWEMCPSSILALHNGTAPWSRSVADLVRRSTNTRGRRTRFRAAGVRSSGCPPPSAGAGFDLATLLRTRA